MMKDRQGNAVTGATAADVRRYDQALGELNIYRGDPVGTIDRTIAEAPGFVMAHLFKAWLMALATEPDAAVEARSILATARTLRMDEREASHVRILGELLDGNWNRAAVAMDRHNVRWPHDLLALQAGHLMDFYRGSARSLRDRIARVLPRWSADLPGYPIVLGMYAFGLEETGDYGRAEAVGGEALDLEPLDCWGHHAVAHVMEMQGRAADGLDWMAAREPYWSGDDNFFKVHNWWHKALYHLDLGQTDAVFGLYDGPIRGQRSAVVLDMVDASALLWRLHLTGHDVGDRWQELATLWDRHADGKLYPFNDWHAVMAYLGAGRERDVAHVLASLRHAGQGCTETAEWARTVARPMAKGFVAFWRGDYEAAAETLHPIRYIASRCGGSHAQRDIIDWTLTEAALRGGLRDLAESLAHERLALKPHSPINRDFLQRARGIVQPAEERRAA